ncbi:MAG: hypothetical protein ACYTF7_11345 [Planctomycetota bacterium]
MGHDRIMRRELSRDRSRRVTYARPVLSGRACRRKWKPVEYTALLVGNHYVRIDGEGGERRIILRDTFDRIYLVCDD